MYLSILVNQRQVKENDMAKFQKRMTAAEHYARKVQRTRANGTAADYRKLSEVNVNKDHARPGDGYRCESEGHSWKGARGKEKRVHTPR